MHHLTAADTAIASYTSHPTNKHTQQRQGTEQRAKGINMSDEMSTLFLRGSSYLQS